MVVVVVATVVVVVVATVVVVVDVVVVVFFVAPVLNEWQIPMRGTLLGVHDSMFFVIIPLPLHSVSMFYLPVLSQEQLTSPSLGFLVSSSSSTSSLPPSYDSVIVVVLVDHVGVDVVEKWSPTHTKT